MAEKQIDPSAKRIREDGGFAIAATVAFAFYCASLATTLVFPVSTQEEIGPTLTVLPALCGLLAFACMQFIALRMRRHPADRHQKGFLMASAVLSLPLLAAMAASSFQLQASLPFQATAWALWGAGQAVAFPLMGIPLAHSDRMSGNRKASPVCIGAAVACSSLLDALALFAPDPFRSFLPALYLAAALSFLVMARALRPDVPACEEREKAFEDISPKILSPIIIGGTFGMVTCSCITHFGMWGTLCATTIGCLAGSIAFLATVATIKRSLTNALIERFYFPVAALCLLFMVAASDSPACLFACVAAGLFFFYAAFHWSLVIALAREQGAVGARHFSVALLAPSTGICIGWGAATLYALAGGDLSHPVLLFFGWIVAYLIVLSIAPYASNTLLEIDLLDPDAAKEAMAQDRSGNSWEQACKRIAEERRLSPREREVFGMLAHGRNVKFIEKTLFISGNTAKTHKYRIYRKLEVGTHQELLDLVEETERKLLGN